MGEPSDSTLGRFWSNFQSFITENSEFPSTLSDKDFNVAADFAADVTKLEDNLYRVYTPQDKEKPEADIVFFHGLYLGKTKDAHVTTWMSSGKPPELWIKTWLVEKFPRARILTVSYDASTTRGDQEGRSDLFLIAESLLYAMAFRNEVGQQRSRPVILVGHSLGTLVIKWLCVIAHRAAFSSVTDREKANKFVSNLRGVFLFAPPNLGMNLNERAFNSQNLSPLVTDLKLLNSSTTRLNEEFHLYCTLHNWIVDGVGESHLTASTSFGESQMDIFRAVMVKEASSRSYMDRFQLVAADHFNICRPADTSSAAFQALVDSIQRMLSSKVPVETFVQIPLPRHMVGLEVHADKILHLMEEAQSVGIFGMGGVGKSTLAKAVVNRIGPDFDHYCFVEAKLEAGRGLKKLQKRVLKSLRDSSVGQGQDGENSVISWEYFEGKRVLIVLDDVDDSEQLSNAVLPDMTYFGHGSILLATSRDVQFFRNFAQYELTVLDTETSRQLFCSHAFEDQAVPPHLEEYVEDVVRKCDGLPLAIELMGSFLYQQENNDMWRDVMRRLSQAEEPSGSHDGRHRLWSTLIISYEALEYSERQMFLDLATIFYGEPLHIIKASWSTSWESSELGLQNLVSKCLVRLVEIDSMPRKRRPFHPYRAAFYAPDTKLTVWIHEQLRDLAQSLVTRPPPSPRDLIPLEKWSRVWRQEDAEKLLRGSYEV